MKNMLYTGACIQEHVPMVNNPNTFEIIIKSITLVSLDNGVRFTIGKSQILQPVHHNLSYAHKNKRTASKLISSFPNHNFFHFFNKKSAKARYLVHERALAWSSYVTGPPIFSCPSANPWRSILIHGFSQGCQPSPIWPAKGYSVMTSSFINCGVIPAVEYT